MICLDVKYNTFVRKLYAMELGLDFVGLNRSNWDLQLNGWKRIQMADDQKDTKWTRRRFIQQGGSFALGSLALVSGACGDPDPKKSAKDMAPDLSGDMASDMMGVRAWNFFSTIMQRRLRTPSHGETGWILEQLRN